MKELFKLTKRGYSWENECVYNLCTPEEFEALKEQWKDYQNTVDGRLKDVRVYFDVRIKEQPEVYVSDGFAERGGVNFVAKGMCITHKSGTLNMDYSSYAYFFTEESIENYEEIKREGWFV